MAPTNKGFQGVRSGRLELSLRLLVSEQHFSVLSSRIWQMAPTNKGFQGVLSGRLWLSFHPLVSEQHFYVLSSRIRQMAPTNKGAPWSSEWSTWTIFTSFCEWTALFCFIIKNTTNCTHKQEGSKEFWVVDWNYLYILLWVNDTFLFYHQAYNELHPQTRGIQGVWSGWLELSLRLLVSERHFSVLSSDFPYSKKWLRSCIMQWKDKNCIDFHQW